MYTLGMEIEFKAKLWKWEGKSAWCFISLPKDYYDEIRTISSLLKKSFGSIKVEARVSDTSFRTSIFPDTKLGTYLLPIKKAVRVAEKLNIGSDVCVNLKLVDF